jgi:glucan 1,3-beta-glucosidase
LLTRTTSQIGFDLNTAPGAVGAEAIIDATVVDTPIFIRTSTASSSSTPISLVLNNIQLTKVPIAVGINGGATVLKGGTKTIGTWGQGNVYSGTSGTGTFTQGSITAVNKPSSLLASTGEVFGRAHPQYQTYDVSQFVSVRDEGAAGDGSTDDTAAIKAIFAKVSTFSIHRDRLLTAMLVRKLQNHIFRCRNLCRFIHDHHPFRYKNCGRGMECYCGPGKRFPR